jgi:hypothetical protein
LAEFVAAGRQLVAIAKRLPYSESVFVFDILEKYERDSKPTLDVIGKEYDLELKELTDLIQSVITTALKSFSDFMEDIKGKRETNSIINISNDGTVNEMTSNVSNEGDTHGV